MRQAVQTIDAPNGSTNLYSVVQQEVELGAQALKREGAEMAVTFFQSALNKLAIEQPFYDHLGHNLLLSYKMLIEKRLKSGDTQTALDFLQAALRLEIKGEMADDSTFLKKFADEFQGLSIVFLQNGRAAESLDPRRLWAGPPVACSRLCGTCRFCGRRRIASSHPGQRDSEWRTASPGLP